MARILLVEDNELNRDMLSRRLGRHGHEILIAIDGQRALEMAHSELPESILLDLRLPDMNGKEIARQLKSEESMRCIPIIALTAHAMEGDRDEALQAGCDDYDTKPVELPRLLEKIKALLGK